jgi:DNA mismatch repair protein MutL
MQTIKILPPQEAQKIAAGEVVERPASVIKELIENSIDAQATAISVHAYDAGKRRIVIADNGGGMSRADALMCFEPHATSKISSVDELEDLSSFGFRGEALASISSVSRVTLTTRNEADELGLKLVRSGGVVESQERLSCPVGTTIEISDLFYNTPARKKFLKQDETEWNQILTVLHAFCLSHKHIAFKLFRDDKRVFNAPATQNLKDRIGQMFDYDLADGMLEILRDEAATGVCVSGYISNHQLWRYNRNHIFFFVNNRFVKNPDLKKALVKGYNNVLPPDRFPLGFVFIEINKSLVDVNVHPRKEEVQFSKPRLVENCVTEQVKKTLEARVTKSLGSHEAVRYADYSFSSAPSSFEAVPLQYEAPVSFNSVPKPAFYSHSAPLPSFVHEQPQEQCKAITFEHKQEENTGLELSSSRIIGQFLNTYILIEQGSELVIIDQHAAHERVLYEEFASYFEKRAGTRLMFPEIVTLSLPHMDIVMSEQLLLENLGIEIQKVGESQVAITSSPPKVLGASLRELLAHLVSFVEENDEADSVLFRQKLTEHVHSHMACKAAVRAGDVLSHEEMVSLIKKLQASNNRLICAHGRPTLWTITCKELEKKFQRCG